ncbi:helix-turn-helix transcriptional regulator [Listeria booriae]|uniref:helix-turn-helix domain-containing protein n=1 Tax=Listeria booriae TaxID=1552123 RepID=UPI0016245388|nr:helix-turn-helix transcriptional regulator [Listeria booriae]MBC1210055.1 helix-turn-helix transcriptional regulator [Listeria booriae]
MRFHEQLEVERKKRGLTLTKLSEQITENTGKATTDERIRNWELGISEIDVPSLRYLCTLYNIKADDFLDSDVDPDFDLNQQYYQFGKQIYDYCQVDNMFEFLKIYDIVYEKDWIFVPKYDIIARTYEDYLKKDDMDDLEKSRCKAALTNLHFWMVEMDSYTEGASESIMDILHVDNPGKLSIADERDPVNMNQVMYELEELRTDLISVLQSSIFDEKEVNPWRYI